MIITELKVKNFQIHKDLTVKFTKGVNVIIGDTDAGKSALIRALHLVIMNNPRSGETIYQNKHYDKPLEIQIKDDQGNTIRRSKKKYYLNGDRMQAVGTDIPIPVMELFPFKSINWQKQLDSHFLILQTGGGAAKILNASSGMEDQETLMKGIKSNITEHKSNIKRLIQNNKEYDAVVTRLRPVTRLLMNAKAIKLLEDQSDDLSNSIKYLNALIRDIKIHTVDPKVYETINDLINEVKALESYTKESNYLDQAIRDINKILQELNEFDKVAGKSAICNKLIHSINSIIDKQKERSNIIIMLNQLNSIVDQIGKTQMDRITFEKELERLEIEFHQILENAGQCPLCGTIFK